MRAALYGRISTTDKGQSSDNQITPMREWLKANKHELVEEYIDQVSGSGKFRRPAFERMMADAQAGKFEMLAFWSLDRLSREGVLITLQHLQKLDKAGVCWRSHCEQFLDSCGPMKDAVLAILAAIARQERIRISERVKAGLERAALEGRKGGRRVVHSDPAMLKRIKDLRQGGYSFADIERETGIPRSSAHRMVVEAT